MRLECVAIYTNSLMYAYYNLGDREMVTVRDAPKGENCPSGKGFNFD